MRSILFVFVAALVAASLVAGCTSTQAPPAAESTHTHERARPPVSVKWIVHAENGKGAQLTARVERLADMAVPASVRFVVPEGVTLNPAPAAFEVPAGGPVVMQHAFEVSWSGEAPTQDLVVVVDVSAADFGLHGEDAYRFGRPPPTLADPQRAKEHLEVGGKDLGQPVDMNR